MGLLPHAFAHVCADRHGWGQPTHIGHVVIFAYLQIAYGTPREGSQGHVYEWV
jgi:hypothetical protein